MTRLFLVVLVVAPLVAACTSEPSQQGNPTTTTAAFVATTPSTPAPTTSIAASTPAPAISPSTTTTPSTTSTTPATTTTAPTTTTLAPIGELAAGLFCRDIYPFGYSYADAVAYWTREGRPDRMDADRNGIPCETVYLSAEVLAFWGDPVPTTTTAHESFVVGLPTYEPESLSGSDGAFGSGCSPGSSKLPDGVWFGFITETSLLSLEVDLACYRPGSVNGPNISNTNPKLRTAAVADHATVWMIWSGGGGVEWWPVPYRDWLVVEPDPALCPEGCWGAWLYINGGEITELVQLFFA